jgi:hypothetical protein
VSVCLCFAYPLSQAAARPIAGYLRHAQEAQQAGVAKESKVGSRLGQTSNEMSNEMSKEVSKEMSNRFL